ncbi:MAG: hypothetical protein ACUVTD_06525 [Nitrososphaerales archaeon]
MGKDKDEKLEEILRLLRRLLSKREGSYKPRANYRPIPRPRVGGHQPTSLYHHYPVYRGAGGKEPKYNPEPKRTSYGLPTLPKELVYQPKERLVYDPEVRKLLQKIESYLRPEQNAEAIQSKPENEPEDTYRQLEAKEESELGKGEEKKIEPALESKNGREKENLEADIEAEIKEDEGTESPIHNEVGVEDSSEDSRQGLSDLEIYVEQVEEPRLSHGVSEPEHNVNAVEQIESKDLSSLEAELYQEPLEPMIEPMEQELSIEAKPKKVWVDLTEEPSEGYGY